LKASRDFGVANIPTIAEIYSERLQIKKDFVQAYLESNVDYYMDQACLESLQLFYEKAARTGAIKSARSLQFV
jgi:predicted solute-binding protein